MPRSDGAEVSEAALTASRQRPRTLASLRKATMANKAARYGSLRREERVRRGLPGSPCQHLIRRRGFSQAPTESASRRHPHYSLRLGQKLVGAGNTLFEEMNCTAVSWAAHNRDGHRQRESLGKGDRSCIRGKALGGISSPCPPVWKTDSSSRPNRSADRSVRFALALALDLMEWSRS